MLDLALTNCAEPDEIGLAGRSGAGVHRQPGILLELDDFRAPGIEVSRASDRTRSLFALQAGREVEPRLPVVRVERDRGAEARLRLDRLALFGPFCPHRPKGGGRT